jgi:hypothetical protein
MRVKLARLVWVGVHTHPLSLHLPSPGKGYLKSQTSLQGKEIVKSTLFCKVCYVLNSDIKLVITMLLSKEFN